MRAFATLLNSLPGFRCALILLIGAIGTIVPNAAPITVLTNNSQVRSLTGEQAAKHLPVRLRGVVLSDSLPAGRAVVMQDQTEAIYLLAPQSLFSKVQRGDLIEVQGVTDPGDFAPIARIQSCKNLGLEKIPEPQRVTFDDLIRRHFDAQYVEISGVVRRCDPSPEPDDLRSRLLIATGGGRLAVRLHLRVPEGSYVDSEVRIRGICFNQHTTSRQFLSPVVDVPRGMTVFVEKAAPANPYDAPTISTAELLEFAPKRDYGHRVLVSGFVTHFQPGESLWIRDGDRGLRVQSRQQLNVREGDLVKVLGFPGHGEYSPILEDAIFEKLGQSEAPQPLLVTNLATVASHDADLIQIEAKLNDKRVVEDGWVFSLEWNSSPIEAKLRLPKGSNVPAAWLNGSLVRAVGICSVTTDSGAALSGVLKPRGFDLLLRAPSDLTIIKPPPWWTHERIMILCGISAALSLAFTVGVMLAARRRLREQAQRRAMAEAEFAAILSERNRMAREIHDTLAQGLVATSVQIRLAKKHANGAGGPVGQHLDAAQQLVSGSLSEARNSIWNMRSQILETSDLPGALRGILKQLSDGSDLETTLEVAGTPRRLSPVLENNLLRVGQEAITNAIKHAQAKRISVKLDFGKKYFRLVTRDDGRGFDATQLPPGEGRFGLVGMRERAAQLNGELKIRSAPGQGTEITLSVPLSDEMKIQE